PTRAPFRFELTLRVNSPLSLVVPTEPGPASLVPSLGMGLKATRALANGLPFRVTLPETGAIFRDAQPSARARARPSSKRALIGSSPFLAAGPRPRQRAARPVN